jgi:CubicO group peptidase (beta-lactamase class C family)
LKPSARSRRRSEVRAGRLSLAASVAPQPAGDNPEDLAVMEHLFPPSRLRSAAAPAFASLVFPLALAACAGRTAGTPPLPTPASASSAALVTQLDAMVPALLAKYGVASIGVALIDDGRVTLTRTYGRQSVGVPATDATLFNLASLTKPVAAETILRLVSAGRLSLDEPISSYWVDPDVAADPRHKLLTARIALSHQTGLPNWRGRSPGGKLAFEFDPGSAFGYSGEGFDYAGRYAEKKLGKSFEALTQEYVFAPIGMTSTSYSRRGWMTGHLAIPLDSAGNWAEAQVVDSAEWNAANNLITTPGDYARFVVSVMKGERLTDAVAAERLQPARGPNLPARPCSVAPPAVCPTAVSFATGWLRLDYADGPVMMFTGLNQRPGGERTIAYFDPRRRHGAVVLTSGDKGQQLFMDVLDLMDPGSPVTAFVRQVR